MTQIITIGEVLNKINLKFNKKYISKLNKKLANTEWFCLMINKLLNDIQLNKEVEIIYPDFNSANSKIGIDTILVEHVLNNIKKYDII
jgi:hypothetical protein